MELNKGAKIREFIFTSILRICLVGLLKVQQCVQLPARLYYSINKLIYLDGSPQTFMYDNRFAAETEAATEQFSKRMSDQSKIRWEGSKAIKKRKLNNFLK